MFTFLSNILGHAYRWILYFFAFLIFDQIFGLAANFIGLYNLQVFLIWFLNKGVFQLLPEQAVVTILNAFTFMFTFDLLMLMFGHENVPAAPSSSHVRHAPGFTSRKV
jgi:hypothetical protein